MFTHTTMTAPVETTLYDAKEAFRQRCAIAVLASQAIFTPQDEEIQDQTALAMAYADALTARFFPDDQN
jgi:hypothetical protein